jgi:hypothetical protein
MVSQASMMIRQARQGEQHLSCRGPGESTGRSGYHGLFAVPNSHSKLKGLRTKPSRIYGGNIYVKGGGGKPTN